MSSANEVGAWRDEHHNTVLHKLACFGCRKDLRYVLRRKTCNLETPNARGETPLLTACKHHRSHIIRELLKHGANVHAVNNHHQSALHLAVLSKNASVIKIVLKAGVDMHLVDIKDRSALYLAVDRNAFGIAELLLKKGADPNQKFERARSVLSVATRNKNETMVRLLLKYGADPCLVNVDGTCPLLFAVRMTDTSVARTMIQLGANVNHRNADEFSIMHEAIFEGQFEQVKLLVEFNADIYARNQTGMTPLHWATFCNKRVSANITKYLVEHGANVNDPDDRGNTCLHFAARLCDVETSYLMLELGADLNVRNRHGDTVLHWAAENDDLDVMRLIQRLTNYSNPDVTDNDGYTPLHNAARSGNIEGCSFLLGEGADIDARTRDDQSPVYLALFARQTETAEFLLRRGAGTHECLTSLIDDENYEEVIDVLLKHFAKLSFGAGVNVEDYEYVCEDDELHQQLEKYEAELAEMKRYKIFDNVTMLDILTADLRKLAGYANNEELVNALKDKLDSDKFPVFSGDVERRLMEEQLRQKIVGDATRVLNDIFRFNDTRHVILEKIVSFLNFHSLLILSKSTNQCARSHVFRRCKHKRK